MSVTISLNGDLVRELDAMTKHKRAVFPTRSSIINFCIQEQLPKLLEDQRGR